jgi:hypothetical protein
MHGPFAARVGTAVVDRDARKGDLNIESSDISRFDIKNRPMCVGYGSDDRETKTKSVILACSVRSEALKRLEDPVDLDRGHPWPSVGHP